MSEAIDAYQKEIDAYQKKVDSRGWGLSGGSARDGEAHPAPAPVVQTDGGMERAAVESPYKDGGNGHTIRNFGRN